MSADTDEDFPEQETFDVEKVYDEQLAPLVDKIQDICEKHRLPFLASFAYRANPSGAWIASAYFVEPERMPEAITHALMVLLPDAKTPEKPVVSA